MHAFQTSQLYKSTVPSLHENRISKRKTIEPCSADYVRTTAKSVDLNPGVALDLEPP